MQQYDTAKHALTHKHNLKLTGNLEIRLFCLYLLNYVIK